MKDYPKYPTCPADLEILTHYYGHAEDISNVDSKFCQERIPIFIEMGLLEHYNQPSCGKLMRYKGTEALKVYMDALLSVPLPTKEWTVKGMEILKRD